MLTREYLDRFRAVARAKLHPGVFSDIHGEAMPSSGGVARGVGPSHLETQALAHMRPTHLRECSDADLKQAWKNLGKWHGAAKRKKADVAIYHRAASHVLQEMRARGFKYDQNSELALEAVRKSTLADRLEELPEVLPMCANAAEVFKAVGGGYGGHVEYAVHRTFGEKISKSVRSQVEDALEDVGVEGNFSGWQVEEDVFKDAIPLYDLVLLRKDIAPEEPIAEGAGVDEEKWKAAKAAAAKAGHADDYAYIQAIYQNMIGKSDAPTLEVKTSGEASRIVCAAPGESKHLIWYNAAVVGAEDAHGHKISRDEIEDQAHRFMLGPRDVRLDHGEVITGRAFVVESWVAPCDITMFQGHALEEPIAEGDWIVCVWYPSDELWNVLSSTPHGISWGGFARKSEVA